MSTSRPDPPMVAGEKETFHGFLDYQRATLLWKCEGLTPEQLGTRAVEPSTLSLHGLVRHMTENEYGWFARTIAGETTTRWVYSTDDRPDADWEDLDPGAYEDDLRRYQDQVERSRQIVAAYDIDHTAEYRDGRQVTLRWVIAHMIEEYARHNGHADFLRERLDGTTGE